MAPPLSIAIVTPTVSRAGGGIFPIVLAHAVHLAEMGHKVTVYSLDDDPQQLDRAQWQGLPLKLYQRGPVGFAAALAADLRAGGHDVLHLHGFWSYLSIVATGWRRETGKPVVISTQGMLEPWALDNSAWKKRLAGLLWEKRNVQGAAAIHCSAAEVAGVRAYAPASTVAVIPNGVDLPDLLSPRPAAPAELAADRHTLLFFGRLHPKKGLAELLQAWALLKASHPQIVAAWHLAIVGWDDGGHAHAWQASARAAGLTAAEVQFLGPRFGEEKVAVWRNAAAFILPSYSEGFPMAVLEAWSYALPVLMTRACNIPDGFAANAAIEISNQPEDLAGTLGTVLSRADLPLIGLAGRQLVERTFVWPRIACELDCVYRWLVGQGERPDCVAAGGSAAPNGD